MQIKRLNLFFLVALLFSSTLFASKAELHDLLKEITEQIFVTRNDANKIKKFLDENQTKINEQDNDGNSPLHLIVGTYDDKTRNTFLNAIVKREDLDVTIKNKAGKTALQVAIDEYLAEPEQLEPFLEKLITHSSATIVYLNKINQYYSKQTVYGLSGIFLLKTTQKLIDERIQQLTTSKKLSPEEEKAKKKRDQLAKTISAKLKAALDIKKRGKEETIDEKKIRLQRRIAAKEKQKKKKRKFKQKIEKEKKKGYKKIATLVEEDIEELTKEIKGLKQDLDTLTKSKPKTEEIPINCFTQTEAYLNPLRLKKWTRKTYADAVDIMLNFYKDERGGIFDDTRLKKQIVEMIDNERKHHKDYFVFYHGLASNLNILLIFYQEIATLLHMVPDQNLLPRVLSSDFNEYPNIETFLQKELDKVNYFNNNDTSKNVANKKLKDFILSTNITIFGNSLASSGASTTLDYYILGQSLRPPELYDIMLEVLNPFLSIIKADNQKAYDDLAEKLKKLIKDYTNILNETKGTLLQIFIHKDVVDDLAYLCFSMGVAFCVSLGTKTNDGKPNFQSDKKLGDPSFPGRPKEISPLLTLLQTDPLNTDPKKITNKNKPDNLDQYNNKLEDMQNGWNSQRKDNWFKNKDYYKKLLGFSNVTDYDPDIDQVYKNIQHYDLWQARVLAHPEYFTDPKKVKIYNFHFKEPDPIDSYTKFSNEVGSFMIKVIAESIVATNLKEWQEKFSELEKNLDPSNYNYIKANKFLTDLTKTDLTKKPLFQLLDSILQRLGLQKPLLKERTDKKNMLHLAFECAAKPYSGWGNAPNWTSIIEKLIDLGFDLEQKDADGKLPLDYGIEVDKITEWVQKNPDQSAVITFKKHMVNNLDHYKTSLEDDEKKSVKKWQNEFKKEEEKKKKKTTAIKEPKPAVTRALETLKSTLIKLVRKVSSVVN